MACSAPKNTLVDARTSADDASAGALFGLEYVRDGLGTAAFTHTLYDFLAFGFILIKWGPQSEEKSEASERS